MQPHSCTNLLCCTAALCFDEGKHFAFPAVPNQGQPCTDASSVTAHPLCCIADGAKLCALMTTLVVDAKRPALPPLASAAGSSTVERSLA